MNKIENITHPGASKGGERPRNVNIFSKVSELPPLTHPGNMPQDFGMVGGGENGSNILQIDSNQFFSVK